MHVFFMQIAGNAKEKEWQKKSLFLPTKHSFLGSFFATD